MLTAMADVSVVARQACGREKCAQPGAVHNCWAMPVSMCGCACHPGNAPDRAGAVASSAHADPWPAGRVRAWMLRLAADLAEQGRTEHAGLLADGALVLPSGGSEERLRLVLESIGYDPGEIERAVVRACEPRSGDEGCPIRAAGCPEHGFVHGGEAEELRAGLEELLERNGLTRDAVERLLDRVDARDSLALLEAADTGAPGARP